MEREENIWRRKYFLEAKEKEENIWRKKNGENTEKEREENLSEKENVTVGGQADIVKIVQEFWTQKSQW